MRMTNAFLTEVLRVVLLLPDPLRRTVSSSARHVGPCQTLLLTQVAKHTPAYAPPHTRRTVYICGYTPIKLA